VPRLDPGDGLLYTVQRSDPLGPDQTSDADAYSVVAISAETGAAAQSTAIGAGYLSDTLQLAPTIVAGRVMYQGTISGIDRIAPVSLSLPGRLNGLAGSASPGQPRGVTSGANSSKSMDILLFNWARATPRSFVAWPITEARAGGRGRGGRNSTSRKPR
jgi:hypothetical protein